MGLFSKNKRVKVRFTTDGYNWQIGYIDKGVDVHTIIAKDGKKYDLATQVKEYN